MAGSGTNGNSNLVCVDDFEKLALKKLPPFVRDYYKSGAGEEYTLKLNVEAFRKFRIRPKVLQDVSFCNIGTTILGEDVAMPLGVSPTAMQRLAHPEGECANAKATAAAGTILILSTLSTSSLEEVAEAAPKGIKWFQLYVYKDRSITLNLVRRAEAAGYKALVLTVDTPVFGVRRLDKKNKFALPGHLTLANFVDGKSNKMYDAVSDSGLAEYCFNLFDPSLSWKDVEWLKSITTLPIVLKGILTAEDALLGIKHGASGILVSNHGARQIDGAPATIEVLPEIVEAVGDKAEVYMDGGIRQGVDVFKALALGAKMVFFGRPLLWGLAYDGETGAKAILDLMQSEIKHIYMLADLPTKYNAKWLFTNLTTAVFKEIYHTEGIDRIYRS